MTFVDKSVRSVCAVFVVIAWFAYFIKMWLN